MACVGDSRCILDSQGVVTDLTVDHRLDCNEEEYVPLTLLVFSSVIRFIAVLKRRLSVLSGGSVSELQVAKSAG